MAVGPLLIFASRLPIMDYSYTYSFESYYIVIPSPTIQSNFAAPWKPFSLTVNRFNRILENIQIKFTVTGLGCIAHQSDYTRSSAICRKLVPSFSAYQGTFIQKYLLGNRLHNSSSNGTRSNLHSIITTDLFIF